MEELIEQYVKGRLPEADRRALEQQLAADPALSEAVESAKLARQAAWSYEQLELRQTALRQLRRERQRPYRLAALAVLILLAGWLVFRFGFSAPNQPVAPAPPPAPAGPVADNFYRRPETDSYLASAADENERQFNLAKQAYDNQRCDEAKPKLEKLADTPDFKYRLESRLLLAACQYEQGGQVPQAIANFRNIIEAAPANSLTAQKAGWYLALAQLKNNETTAARQALEAIAADSGHPYAAEAKKLLDATK